VIDHLTTTPGNGSVTAFVLVGPPASGKSTVRSLFEDHGAVGRDLASLRDAPSVALDDDTAFGIAHTVAEARSSDVPVACIEGAVCDADVDRVRELADTTLVVRVLVPEASERLRRYVDRELAYTAGEAVPADRRTAVRMYAQAREQTERPYPTHTVSIVNSHDTSVTALYNRIGRLINTMTTTATCDTTPCSTTTATSDSKLPELSTFVSTTELDIESIDELPSEVESALPTNP